MQLWGVDRPFAPRPILRQPILRLGHADSTQGDGRRGFEVSLRGDQEGLVRSCVFGR